MLKDFVKLPIRMLRRWRRNSDALNPKVYKTLDNISFTHELKIYFYHYKNLIGARRFNYYDYLNNTSEFIYFPLHVQPEVSTNLWAPYFSNQLEVIRQIAISLPGKYTLLVKEHPIMLGWRSTAYYEKINGLPNVKLIPYKFNSYEVMSNNYCKGVIVISGTSGFEAILLKKPTIMLSNMFYDVLPHCFRVKDIANIPDTIKKMDSLDLSLKENEEKLILLIATLYEQSIALNYSSLWGLNKDGSIDNFLELIENKVKDLVK